MPRTVEIEEGWRLVNSEGDEVGTINTTGNVLRKLEISPDHRNQGYGTAAFGAWLDACRQDGYDEAYVMMIVNDMMAAIVIEAGYPYEEVDDEDVPLDTPEYDETGPNNPNFRIELG